MRYRVPPTTPYDDPEPGKHMRRCDRRRAVERFSIDDPQGKAQVDALIDIYRSLVQGPAR